MVRDCKPYFLPGKLYELLPEIYRDYDKLNNLVQRDVGYGPEGQLARFLHILEEELDKAKCFIDNYLYLFDVDECPCEYLPYIAALLGLEPNYDLSCDDQRREIKEIVSIYKRKGTLTGLYQLTKTFTDFNLTIVEFYRNMLVRNKIDTHTIEKDVYNHVYNFTEDTSFHRYSITEGPYKRNCIGLILDANNCDDSLNSTNLRKMKRVLELYVPAGVEYFIIVRWKCQRTLNFVSNIERTDQVGIFAKNQIGAYYSRWWLERQKDWKTRFPDGDYLRHFIGPEIRTNFEYFQNVQTNYSIIEPPIPPSATDQRFRGFGELNPLYFSAVYYDGGAWQNKIYRFDSNSWVVEHTAPNYIYKVRSQEEQLYSLTQSNGSQRFNFTDGWETMNPPGSGVYNYFKVGGEYFLSTDLNEFSSERDFYYSGNFDGPWINAGYKVYDDASCVVNDRYYFGGGYANVLTQVDTVTKLREIFSQIPCSLYKTIKQFGNRVIAVGGNGSTYTAIIDEYDANNFGTPNWHNRIEHKSKVPIDFIDDLMFFDIIDQVDGFLLLGHHNFFDHKANKIYKCDLNFENWLELFIEPQIDNPTGNWFQQFKEYDNKLYVGATQPVRVYEFITLIEPLAPDIQSLTLESSTDVDVINPNAEIADMIPYNNEAYILYNYDDGGNPTGKGNKVIRNTSPGIWTTSLTLAHISSYLTLVDNDMYLGHDYFVDNFAQSHSDDSYRFNGSIWENLNSQHVDSGTGHTLGKNKFFHKIGSTYYSFSISSGPSPTQIYSTTNPLSWQQYPNYIWDNIYADIFKGVVFDNKVYFRSLSSGSDIYIFDPIALSVDVINLSGFLNILEGFFVKDNKIYGYGRTFAGQKNVNIIDITNSLSLVEVGQILSFKTAGRFVIRTVEIIGDDIVFIGYDSSTNENLIYTSKNFEHYIELLREANEFVSTPASHTFKFSAVNGTDLFVGLGGVSNIRVKKYNLNY